MLLFWLISRWVWEFIWPRRFRSSHAKEHYAQGKRAASVIALRQRERRHQPTNFVE